METLHEYLDLLASERPVPGGGSAAAVSAALGAALVAMVARIAHGGANDPAALAAIVARADELRAQLEAARLRDERAFDGVIEAQRLPKASEAEKALRRDALESALEAAAQAPLDATALCVAVLELTPPLLDAAGKALRSDVGCAAEFAFAGLAGCAYNVRVNHRFMRDAAKIGRQEGVLSQRERIGRELLERTRAGLV